MITQDELMQMIQRYAKSFNFVPIRKNIEAIAEISIAINELYKRAGVQDDEQNRSDTNSCNN